ncbi:MAG: argJ [Clostridia bacterium]|nr:argJ [Clostridia bacterium]
MEQIITFVENGGVTTPKGFKAAGVYCGIRKNKEKKDLALIYAEKRCNAAAVYTKNLVKGAPLYVTMANLTDGMAQAVICNSGNANTCNADGEEKANEVCTFLGKALNISRDDIIIASTGVIGQPINNTAILNGIPALINNLSNNGTDAATAIMTTDLKVKEVAVSFEIEGKKVFLGGMAKGSGMINPNMATMLGFLTTDADISSEMLKAALTESVEETFNMISVDGDTSTNDMVSVMASGLAGNVKITEKNDNYYIFLEALNILNTCLSAKIAKDGEGATKLIKCKVENAKNREIARKVSLTVISSSLVKAAMFGEDANWGRVLCAIGYSGCDVDIKKIDVDFISENGTVSVCKNGAGVEFSEEIAKKVLSVDEIIIAVNLKDGSSVATAYGCDLTYDYVRINGDYRT